MFILYHECTNSTMPSTLLVLRTIPPTLRTFHPNRPKWVHFCRVLPHSAKKSPFPGIKKAGRERTLSGQMTPFLHFPPSEGALLSIQPYILTSYQSKHAKRTTQASYQNLGGYMVEARGIEPLSEDRITGFSPSAGRILDFPCPSACERAMGLGSFILPASPQSLGGPVPHINDAACQSRERFGATRSH